MRENLEKEYHNAYAEWNGTYAKHNLHHHTNEELAIQATQYRVWAREDKKRRQMHESNYLQSAKLTLAVHLNTTNAEHHGERRTKERVD